MPIDSNITNAMFDPFKNMLKDCESKGLSGPDIDAMRSKLERMETLAQEHSDLNQFNAALMGEDLFNKFSQAYSSALATQGKAQAEERGYDDETLLKQTLDAYRDTIKRIKEGRDQAIQVAKNKDVRNDSSNEVATLFKDEALIKPIEEAIKLGESGVSFPVFLRNMIEKGLDKAMEGSAVTREGMEYTLGWAKANMLSPHEIKMREEIIEEFDKLASKAAFGVPDSLQVTLTEDKICHKYKPDIAKWNAITDTWERVLGSIDHWIISYCKFAPSIEPWSLSRNPQQAVIKTQDTEPGKFKVYEKLLQEYHGMSWEDIFTHDTFINEIKAYRLGYSAERIAFLREQVYPQIKPFNHPPKEVIAEAERMRAEKLENNPELHRSIERPAAYYNKIFGEGLFEKKYGMSKKIDSNAKPWNV